MKLPEIQKMEEDDKFLTQMLMDLSFESMHTRAMVASNAGISDASKIQDMKLSEVPVMDEITRGFWKLREDGEISAWVVFAARILQDIQEILGDRVGESWEELKITARKSKESLQIKFELTELWSQAESAGWIRTPNFLEKSTRTARYWKRMCTKQ